VTNVSKGCRRGVMGLWRVRMEEETGDAGGRARSKILCIFAICFIDISLRADILQVL